MKPIQLSTTCSAIALYGGSFDPVHCAHLAVARVALEQAALDRVVFIPAARSPLKANPTSASDADRIEMLRLATQEEPRFAVDTSEIERGGTSYTVDTVKDYGARFPDLRLHWIIGADQFELLPKWHRIVDIAALVTFIVLRRPGYTIADSTVSELKYLTIEAPLMPHSSSEIRALLAKGDLTGDFVPPTVEAFISSRGLYTR